MPSLTRPGKPTIHYEIDDYSDPWKHAPILMLQHGFSRSHRVWYSWVPYLSRFYKVVRADLRGLGLSAVLGVVRSHKGALKVYGQQGRPEFDWKRT